MRGVKQVRVGAAIGKGCVRFLRLLDSDFSFQDFSFSAFQRFPHGRSRPGTLGEWLALKNAREAPWAVLTFDR